MKKMKTALLNILVFISLCQNSFAQSTQWVKQIGAKGYSMKIDKENHFYITGSFENEVMFDNINASSKGLTDIYVARYSIDGSLNWVKTAGGEWWDEGFSLAINPAGDNIFTTGFMKDALFEDSIRIGYPFFIANYDSSGNLKWAQSLRTSGGGGAISISADNSGQIYLTGSAYDLIIPDSLGFSGTNYFIIKYDESGKLLWIRGTNGTLNSLAVQPAQAGITYDIYNNIYVAGSIQSEEIKFDSTHILIPEGVLNVFVVKYDSNGNVVKAIQSKGPGQAYPISIAVDTASNIYLTGCFEGSVQFDDVILESSGSFDIFTAKYNENGDLHWVKKAGSNKYDSGRSIKVDNNGNVYMAGINSVSATFDNAILDKGGVFIAKYDGDGNLINLKNVFFVNDNIFVSGNNFTVNDFALINNEEYIMTGFFNETVHFDTLELSGIGGGNIFIAKISNVTTDVKQSAFIPSKLSLYQNYPNPFNPITKIEYYLPNTTFVSLIIYDLKGREIKRLVEEEQFSGKHILTWNGTNDKNQNVSSSIYFYSLETSGNKIIRKMILLK